MSQSRKTSITRAFTAHSAITFLAVAGAGIALCAYTSRESSEQFGLAWSRTVAETVVHSMQADEGRTFADAARDAVSRTPALLAVGMLSAKGDLGDVYPERPELRQVLRGSVFLSQEAVTVRLSHSEEPSRACIHRLSLNGDDSPQSQRALFLIKDPASGTLWMGSTQRFAMAVFAVVCVAVLAQCRWFRNKVGEPVEFLAFAGSKNKPLDTWDRKRPSFSTRELRTLVCRLESALRDKDANEKRIRQLEQTSQEMLRATTKGYEHKLRRATDEAMIDPLTGLRNRRFLEQELDCLYAQHQQQGMDFCIIMVDLDNFKVHNDTLGHKAGDELLRFVGSLLAASIRDEDAAVRYGGDEFVLLLRDTDWRTAVKIAERTTKMFSQYVKQVSPSSPVSLSAGVASLRTDHCPTGEELMKRADEALYRAKEGGKNLVACTATSDLV